MRVLILCLFCTIAFADWPRFRDKNGTGVSAETGLPAEIGPGKNVLWKSKSLKGNSSPIVVKGRLWITGHEGDDRVLLCYNAATGELV